MKDIITMNYEGTDLVFTEDGFFNATLAAAKYGKKPAQWLRLGVTKEYVEALCEFHTSKGSSVCQKHTAIRSAEDLVVTVNGGTSPGTWLHPKLAVAFARWLDVKFSVWCDNQIDLLLRNENPALALANLVDEMNTAIDNVGVHNQAFREYEQSLMLVRRALESATRVVNKTLPKPLPNYKEAKLSQIAERINREVWFGKKPVRLEDFCRIELTEDEVLHYACEVSAKKTTLGELNGEIRAFAPFGGREVECSPFALLGSDSVN